MLCSLSILFGPAVDSMVNWTLEEEKKKIFPCFIILTILLAWDALYSPAGAKESDRRRGDPSQSRWRVYTPLVVFYEKRLVKIGQKKKTDGWFLPNPFFSQSLDCNEADLGTLVPPFISFSNIEEKRRFPPFFLTALFKFLGISFIPKHLLSVSE